MRMRYFGDSYDIVKRFLLHTISPEGDWAALPMFTEPVTLGEVVQFEAFLGARVVRPDPVVPGEDRRSYFILPSSEHRILVDPNKGVRMGRPSRARASVDYVFPEEVVGLCRGEPRRLVVTFDQSHVRGQEPESLSGKLAAFRREGVHGFAYRSHACFLVLTADEALATEAQAHLVAAGLPGDKLIGTRAGPT